MSHFHLLAQAHRLSGPPGAAMWNPGTRSTMTPEFKTLVLIILRAAKQLCTNLEKLLKGERIPGIE
ncbi:MAG: hypothetical protein WC455_19800 [Dehalococcoidia bacterium]